MEVRLMQSHHGCVPLPLPSCVLVFFSSLTKVRGDVLETSFDSRTPSTLGTLS